MSEHGSPTSPRGRRESLTWGGIDVVHGEQPPEPNPFHGLDTADVVHTGEVTIDFDGTPVTAMTFTTRRAG